MQVIVPPSPLAESHLISSILVLFRHDEHLRHFMFHHQELRLRDTPAALLKEARGFSRGERILIQIGLDFWSGKGSARLHDLIDHLDDENIIAFIRTILRLR